MIRSGTGKSLCVLDANGVTWHTLSGYKLRENLFTNPSFESASGTVNVRTNLATNPSFETATGTTNVRTNLFTNPSFETTTGTTAVRTNIVQNPSFEKSNGTNFLRTNLFPNPSAETGTTGWGSAGGNVTTITRDTTVGLFGSSSLKATWTTDGNGLIETSTNGGNAASVSASSPYTASAYVRLTTGAVRDIRLYINWFTSAGVYISQVQGPLTAAVSGQWLRLSVVNALAPATAAYASVGFNFGAVLSTDVFHVDGLLVENSTAVLPYFDGSRPLGNLTANPSVETNSVDWNYWAGYSGSATAGRSTASSGASGSAFYRVTWGTSQTTDGQRGGVWMDATAVSPGVTYSVSAAARSSKQQNLAIQVEWVVAAKDNTVGVVTGPTVAVGAGAWTRLQLDNVTAPVGAAWLRVAVYSAPTTGIKWLAGDYVDMDAVLVEYGTAGARYYYEGTGDFTYAWASTANASISYVKGTGIDTAGSNRSAIYQALSVSRRPGGKSMAIRANGFQDNPGAIINAGSTAFVVGKQYTVSGYFMFPSSPVGVRFGLGGPWNGVSSPVTPVAGVWTRVSHTFTATATTGLTLFPEVAATTPAAGTTYYLDDVLVEEGPVLGTYFDGSTPIQNLVTNPSLETNTTYYAVNQGNGVVSTSRPTTGGYAGSAYYRCTWTTGATVSPYLEYNGLSASGIIAGETYTASAYIRTSFTTTMYVKAVWWDGSAAAGTAAQGSTITVPAYTWTRVPVVNAVAPAGAIGVWLDWFIADGIVPTNGTVDMDAVLVEQSPKLNQYYEGTGDFTYSWSGVADASTSVQTAPAFSQYSPDTVAAKVYQSGLWATRPSTKALRISPISSSADSFADVWPTLTTGKTYTVSATFYQNAPQTGTLDSRARSLLVVQGGSTTSQAQATNVAGAQRVSLTFTLTQAFTLMRLYNGASMGNGDVWWDDFLLEESGVASPYFDGSNPIANFAPSPDMSVGWDLRWFGGGTSTGTYVSTSGATPVGNSFLRKTWTAGTPALNNDTGFHTANVGGMYPGSTVTLSGYLRPSVGDKQGYARLGWSDGTVSSGTPVSLPANTWTRVSVTAVVPVGVTAVSPIIDIYSTGALWATGQTLDGTGVLLERSDTVNPYYAGQGDFTYSWSGAANASLSNQVAPAIAGWGGGWKGYQSSMVSMYGSKSMAMRRYHSAAGSGYYTFNTGMTTTVGQLYTFSAWFYGGTGTYKIFLNDNVNSQSLGTTPTFTAPGNTWTRYSFTFAATSAFTNLSMFVSDDSNVSPTAGSVLYMDGVLFEQAQLGSYFDGTTAAAGDFTYVWSGTAHGSTSYEQAPALVGSLSNAQSKVWRSSDWAQTGTYSLRIHPFNNSADSYAAIGGDVGGGLRMGMVAGKTYTAMATCRVKTARVSGMTGRNIRVYWPDGAGGYTTTESSSGGVPNAPGVYPVKVTFTIPSGKTECFIRLYHATSGATGDDDVWWDNFMLVEGDGTDVNGYFDGNTPADEYFTYSWAGTPHASISRATP